LSSKLVCHPTAFVLTQSQFPFLSPTSTCSAMCGWQLPEETFFIYMEWHILDFENEIYECISFKMNLTNLFFPQNVKLKLLLGFHEKKMGITKTDFSQYWNTQEKEKRETVEISVGVLG
jgi:hypothetical protein